MTITRFCIGLIWMMSDCAWLRDGRIEFHGSTRYLREMYLWRTLICLAVFLSTALAAISGTLDERKYHLRSTEQPEWEEFAKQTPHGRRLDIRFQGEPNETEQTLIIRQYDVKLDWI